MQAKGGAGRDLGSLLVVDNLLISHSIFATSMNAWTTAWLLVAGDERHLDQGRQSVIQVARVRLDWNPGDA